VVARVWGRVRSGYGRAVELDDKRTELGETDAPTEDELATAFDRIVDEGSQRLHRSWREVLTTGLAGGLEVAMGVLALLAVYAETGSHLLAGIAFSIGFIALLLARSELFTEGFLVPVTAVVAGRAAPVQLGKLWGGTLVANLVGGWLVTPP
jgi:formate/nitrite transporter FocA (FNT family)